MSAEHDEPWPGGRSNHYLFDMNRDWFAQTQPETRGRLTVALDYFPHVVVDLHEMGGDSSYYFAPPADPLNPFITPDQIRWLETFGRANAARFDDRGFAYFIREVYDSFYPGYGESWPIFNGAIGMTYEQASARGLVFTRDDDTTLTYRQGVVHHFNAAITTAYTAAGNRERLLRDFLEYRRSAIAEGEKAGTREYVLLPGNDPAWPARLARNLAGQGIDVRMASEAFKVGTRDVPAGAYLVSAAQPSGRLVRNLLDTHVPQPEAFVKEQDRRRKKRLGDQIYDVTGWSLPALFDVEVITSAQALTPASTPRQRRQPPQPRPPCRRPRSPTCCRGAATRPAPSTRCFGPACACTRPAAASPSAPRPMRPAPRLSVWPNLARASARRWPASSRRHGVPVVALDSGWVDRGVSLGSGDVAALKVPRIVLAWDAPTSSLSAGWTRYVLERRFGFTVSAVRVSSLGRLDLDKVDVLVLPQGSYATAFNDDAVRRLREWMRGGGTLVTLGEASRWAAGEKVSLLDTRPELRGGKPDVEEKDKKPTDPPQPFDYDKAVQPERERPENIPGAVVRVRLDLEHWLASGTDGEIQAIVEGQRVFTPLKLDKGHQRRHLRGQGQARRRRPGVGRGAVTAGAEGVPHAPARGAGPHHRLCRRAQLPRVHRSDAAAVCQRSVAGGGVLATGGPRAGPAGCYLITATDGGSLFNDAATLSAFRITRRMFRPRIFLMSSSP